MSGTHRVTRRIPAAAPAHRIDAGPKPVTL
jgi:hypothetical protein